MQNQLQTALILLWAIALSVLTAMPVLAWLMLASRRDASARIWYLGMGFYAAGAFLLASQYVVDGWMSLVGGPVVSFLMPLCMHEALRRDLERGPMRLRYPLGLWLAFAFGAVLFYVLDLRTTGGQIYLSLLWTVSELAILRQTILLRQRHASRGALVIALAMVLAVSSHLLRVVYVGLMGGSVHLLDLQPVSNYFYLVNLVGVTLCSFGYWGYVLEKSQRNELSLQLQAQTAETETRLARAHAQEMQELVTLRNQMLMLNSRFTAINSLAIFNSALIHEVSQPVQAISLCLDTAALQAEQHGLTVMNLPLSDARKQMGKLASLLSVMRKLVSEQGENTELVQLCQVQDEILPVLRSEAARRGVAWHEDVQIQQATVMANKVLLERLLLNLVGNALDAVGAQVERGEPAQIRLCVQQAGEAGAARLLIAVEDNGPGLPDPDMALNPPAFQSSKAHGLGVGLAFARLLVRQWGGELTVQSLKSGQMGVCATIMLPMVS